MHYNRYILTTNTTQMEDAKTVLMGLGIFIAAILIIVAVRWAVGKASQSVKDTIDDNY